MINEEFNNIITNLNGLLNDSLDEIISEEDMKIYEATRKKKDKVEDKKEE
jgi:hypothetical protein